MLVIEGDASLRCGISLKGADIVVGGSVGSFSAFMAQAGRIVICGDAGDALGDSLYEAVIYVRGKVRSLGADARFEPMTDADLRGGARVARQRRPRRTIRGTSSAWRRRRACITGMPMPTRSIETMDENLQLEESAGFDRRVIDYIQRAAATGLYEIRGLGAKRHAAASFDDLVFLGASLSRYPLEGYREKCSTRTVLGTRFATQADRARHSHHHRRHELRRAVGAREGGARPRRDRGRHVDHHRRWRHDARGARARRRPWSTSACRRATASIPTTCAAPMPSRS